MRTELNSVNIIYWQVGDEVEFSSREGALPHE